MLITLRASRVKNKILYVWLLFSKISFLWGKNREKKFKRSNLDSYHGIYTEINTLFKE